MSIVLALQYARRPDLDVRMLDTKVTLTNPNPNLQKIWPNVACVEIEVGSVQFVIVALEK